MRYVHLLWRSFCVWNDACWDPFIKCGVPSFSWPRILHMNGFRSVLFRDLIQDGVVVGFVQADCLLEPRQIVYRSRRLFLLWAWSFLSCGNLLLSWSWRFLLLSPCCGLGACSVRPKRGHQHGASLWQVAQHQTLPYRTATAYPRRQA